MRMPTVKNLSHYIIALAILVLAAAIYFRDLGSTAPTSVPHRDLVAVIKNLGRFQLSAWGAGGDRSPRYGYIVIDTDCMEKAKETSKKKTLNAIVQGCMAHGYEVVTR